jgi:hypothetical protein
VVADGLRGPGGARRPARAGDLDLVCTAAEAVRLGEVLADALSNFSGRAFWAAMVEWIGGPKPPVDQPLPSDAGGSPRAGCKTAGGQAGSAGLRRWTLQRAVSQRRGFINRVALIDAVDRA